MNKKFYSRSHDFLLFFVLIFVDKNARKNKQQERTEMCEHEERN